MSQSTKVLKEFGKVTAGTSTITTATITTANVVDVIIEKGTVTQITSATTGVTVNASAAVITTFAAANVAGAATTFTVTNNKVGTSSVILTTLVDYAGTTGLPVVQVDGGAGSGVFNVVITNIHATDPLNGTLTISVLVV